MHALKEISVSHDKIDEEVDEDYLEESQDNTYFRAEQALDSRGLQAIEERPVNMRLQAIRNGFSLSERFSNYCGGITRLCANSEKNYVTRGYTTNQMERDAATIEARNAAYFNSLRQKILYIKIHDTNGLELDPVVIHPFVRVHIIDITTGCYLKKSSDHNVLHSYENLGQLNRGVYFTGESPFILPFATPPFDLRVKGENDPHWDAEFLLDEEADIILNPKTVFLFEILDFNFRLVREKSPKLRPDKMYPIAWAFFRPIGSSGMHLGVTKLQLYRYKYKSTYHEHRRPQVFYDFNWPNKQLYPSFLRVELHTQYAPERCIVYRPPVSVFEREEGEVPWDELAGRGGRAHKHALAGKEEMDADAQKRAIKLTKWRRLYNEPCAVPTSLNYKFDTCKRGAWRLKFSNNGKHLAVACTDETTSIKIFQVEDGELVQTLRGHADIIHDLTWTNDDRYLLSCSSDGTARLWDLGGFLAMSLEQGPVNQELCTACLHHGSYVYTGKFHPNQSYYSALFIATGSFDGKLRFWAYTNGMVTLLREMAIYPEKLLDYGYLEENRMSNNEQAFLEHYHPNVLQFDNQETLFVGDSQGLIHIITVSVRNDDLEVSLVRQVEFDELSKDPVNHMELQPPEKKYLIVQSRDNVIRRVEPSRYAHADSPDLIDTRFFAAKFQKYNVRSCLSPDGRYLLSGSEDGKPHLWDISSGFYVDLSHWEVSVKDLISDVDWNPVYNMVAIAAFGSELPVYVFIHEKTQEEVEKYLANAHMNNEDEYLAPHKEQYSEMAQEYRQLPPRF